jgi:hypothetical protein
LIKFYSIIIKFFAFHKFKFFFYSQNKVIILVEYVKKSFELFSMTFTSTMAQILFLTVTFHCITSTFGITESGRIIKSIKYRYPLTQKSEWAKASTYILYNSYELLRIEYQFKKFKSDSVVINSHLKCKTKNIQSIRFYWIIIFLNTRIIILYQIAYEKFSFNKLNNE